PSGGNDTACPPRQCHCRASFGGRVANEDVKDIARKYYLEYGGQDICDEGRLLEREPTVDAVQLSGKWEGGATQLSRLLRSIWKQPCFAAVSVAVQGQLTTKYISNVSRDKIIRVLNDLTTLSTFFEENKPFIEGLT